MHAAEILSVLDPGATLPCEHRRFWIYLTCYQALRATGHPRASEVLSTAHERLLQEAETISDEALRHSFLENVVENRELVRAWEAAQAGVSPGDAWA
jgi:hypothetical protein